jgi:hypothetical protein
MFPIRVKQIRLVDILPCVQDIIIINIQLYKIALWILKLTLQQFQASCHTLKVNTEVKKIKKTLKKTYVDVFFVLLHLRLCLFQCFVYLKEA